MLQKKLSIPATVGWVLEYIPQLQKEVDDLNRKKEHILSTISVQDGYPVEFIQEKKPRRSTIKETTSSCTISVNRLGDKEMVIQISAFERISMSKVILLLEKNGYVVIDVSCFQTFGGTSFNNIHLGVSIIFIFEYETKLASIVYYGAEFTTLICDFLYSICDQRGR